MKNFLKKISFKNKKHLVGLSFVLFIIFSIAYVKVPYFTENVITIKVTDKERIDRGNGTGYYVVYAEGESFKNEDSYFYLKFNSTDVQGKLRIGRDYDVKVTGFRIPILSEYRNIIKVVKEIESTETTGE